MTSITVYERTKKIRKMQTLRAKLMILNVEVAQIAQEIAVLKNQLDQEHVVVGKVRK